MAAARLRRQSIERNVEHAFGADFRGLFVILADDDRPQSGRVSRGAEVPIRVAPLAALAEISRARLKEKTRDGKLGCNVIVTGAAKNLDYSA